MLLTVCKGTVSPTGAQQDGEEGWGVGVREKRQMGLQSLKSMSLICAGRRQLLSEFVVAVEASSDTQSPLLSFLNTPLSLMYVSGV